MTISRSLDDQLKDAISYYNQGEYKKSKAHLRDIIDIDKKNVDAFFYLANIFHINGEIGKAIKAFNKVLLLDPSHTDAAISLSVLYNDIGHYEEASSVFQKAEERVKTRGPNSDLMDDLHINKKFALKHTEIADLYLTYNRFDEALFEYNKVVALDPSNLEARINVAKVYAKKGFISKSFDELKKLKAEEPEFMPARVALGVLYCGSGKILEAQSEWERVISKDPLNQDAGMYLNLSKTANETSL